MLSGPFCWLEITRIGIMPQLCKGVPNDPGTLTAYQYLHTAFLGTQSIRFPYPILSQEHTILSLGCQPVSSINAPLELARRIISFQALSANLFSMRSANRCAAILLNSDINL